MTLDIASFQPMLKQLYPDEAIRQMGYLSNPFYALVARDTDFVGEVSKEPIVVSAVQNRSATFSTANTSATNSITRAFLLSRVQNYSNAYIANEILLASMSDKGAFLQALKFEIDKALFSLTKSIATQLFRAGTGTVARIASTATINSAVTMVVLANPEDIVNIEYGMNLAFSATDGGAARAYASTGAYVVSVDRQAGSFLCSATFGGAAAALTSLITGVAVSDYIYQSAGDINKTISGLQAFLPGSAVTSTSFFGVDRTIDKTRLAGITLDASSYSIDEALIQGSNLVAREGGRPDYVFMSFKDFSNLVTTLGAKQQYIQHTNVDVKDPGVSVGYSGVKIIGATGPMTVVPDVNCPVGKAFVLQMDTWKLKSLGEPARLFDGDSLTVIRDPSGDNVIVRCVSYAQLSCRAPGWNAVVTLPS